MVGKITGSGQNINIFLNSKPSRSASESNLNFIHVLKNEFQKHIGSLKEDGDISGVYRYSLSINKDQFKPPLA
jgi:hypothetical protein